MRPIAAVLTLSLTVLAAAACEDPNDFRIDPLLVEDTVTLAAPSASDTLPSALDITASSGAILGRFPERVEDAEQVDILLRVRDGQLVFLPAGAVGLQNPPPIGGPSRAAITQPLSQTFEELIEAPTRASFVTDSAVVVRQGAVYAARSRESPGSFSRCTTYAKLQPLTVQPAQGRVTLRVIANARCNDPRLVEVE